MLYILAILAIVLMVIFHHHFLDGVDIVVNAFVHPIRQSRRLRDRIKRLQRQISVRRARRARRATLLRNGSVFAPLSTSWDLSDYRPDPNVQVHILGAHEAGSAIAQ